MRPKGLFICKGVAPDIPMPRCNRLHQDTRRVSIQAGRQRDDHLMLARQVTRSDLFQDIMPPLQTHLRDHRLFGKPRSLGDFEVEGVERK